MCVDLLTVVAERRKQPRNHSNLSAIIRALACDRRLPGRILDLASEGLAVLSPEPLEPNAAVAVTYKGVLILAEVVYCNASVAGYRAGLRIDQALATTDLTVRDAENEIRTLTRGRPVADVSTPVSTRADASSA